MPTNRPLREALDELHLSAAKIDAIADVMVVGTDLEQSSVQSFGVILADFASEVIAITKQIGEDV